MLKLVSLWLYLLRFWWCSAHISGRRKHLQVTNEYLIRCEAKELEEKSKKTVYVHERGNFYVDEARRRLKSAVGLW